MSDPVGKESLGSPNSHGGEEVPSNSPSPDTVYGDGNKAKEDDGAGETTRASTYKGRTEFIVTQLYLKGETPASQAPANATENWVNLKQDFAIESNKMKSRIARCQALTDSPPDMNLGQYHSQYKATMNDLNNEVSWDKLFMVQQGQKYGVDKEDIIHQLDLLQELVDMPLDEIARQLTVDTNGPYYECGPDGVKYIPASTSDPDSRLPPLPPMLRGFIRLDDSFGRDEPGKGPSFGPSNSSVISIPQGMGSNFRLVLSGGDRTPKSVMGTMDGRPGEPNNGADGNPGGDDNNDDSKDKYYE